MWPQRINISDGLLIEDGFLSATLSSVWNKVEAKASNISELHDLMTWKIFSNLHSIAKTSYFKHEKYIYTNQLEKDKVRATFENNLQEKGFENLLNEYKLSNS